MKTIKFRVWDKKRNKWIYPIRDITNNFNSKGNEHLVFEQFTGLTDRNGVEIYKGDILKTDTINQYVDWNQTLVCYGLRQSKNSATRSIDSEFDVSMFEVIGNIHDNPELL